MAQSPAVVDPVAGLPTQFDPSKVKESLIKIEAVIDYARKIHDWELLADAVDAMIGWQSGTVEWWRETVKHVGSPAKKGQELIRQERGALTETEAEAQIQIKHQRVSDWKKLLKDIPKYRERQIVAAMKKAKVVSADNHRAEGTGENEWFTPAKYTEAARKVMGGIDLDPATHRKAQETIQATNFFTREDDSLQKEWAGRVWLNPPYSQPEIFQFCEKLVEEVSASRVQQAILLTHNYTDTAWFHLAESICQAICFTRGRVPFEDMDGEKCAPTQGQAFFYYGESVDKFCAVFNEFGFLVRPT